MAEELIVNEIFYSLQGESSLVGYPTVFVRLYRLPSALPSTVIQPMLFMKARR